MGAYPGYYGIGIMQLVVGDQLTLKNIRTSKLWRQAEVESHNRLSWVNKVPDITKNYTKLIKYWYQTHNIMQVIFTSCGSVSVLSTLCSGELQIKRDHCAISGS